MEQTVTGCKDCPLRVYYGDWDEHICQHPQSPKDDEIHDFPITPDWCPLKTESLTLNFQST